MLLLEQAFQSVEPPYASYATEQSCSKG